MFHDVRILRAIVSAALLAFLPGAGVAAAQDDTQDQSSAPAARRNDLRVADWLDVSFSSRFRYETVSNRFKLGETGGDQQLPHRDRIGFGIKRIIDPVRFYFEFEHSDAYLTDSGSLVNTTMVDRHDILQLNVSLVLNQEGGAKHPSVLTFGRQSFDLGSRRLFARNRYRNTTNRWDGLRWTLSGSQRWTLDTFFFQPVQLRKGQMDRRVKGAYFWGSYFTTRLKRGAGLDLYYFHIHEGADSVSQHRRVATFGGRFHRAAVPGAFGWEVESALQVGKKAGLDHFAHLQHFQLSYVLNVPWRPSIAGSWDYASGDGDPTDDRDGNFDTLAGARRFEYGPTGILNWMYRSNINSPDIHLGFRPVKKLEFLPAFRWLWLARAKGPWAGTNLQDVTGRSGSYVGSLTELRFRYTFATCFRPEIGYARFFKGSYTFEAPGSPATGDSNYFFIDLELNVRDLLP